MAKENAIHNNCSSTSTNYNYSISPLNSVLPFSFSCDPGRFARGF